jgi:two-component system, NarL family, nitrate/nitrite response regulator NarL
MEGKMETLKTAIRIMLVDDHETMLWGLGKLIEGEMPRMQVVGTAKSGDEALAKITHLVPDIILLDLDLDGKSALDILPGMLSNSLSRILILSGTRESATLDSAIRLGARGVLHKDAAPNTVLKAIEKIDAGELWLDRETLGRVFGDIMNPKEARKLQLDSEGKKIAALTGRERNVIRTVVEGNGALNKTLALRLFISEHTMRNHLTSIYQKLGLSNRLELYVYALKHGLQNIPAE